jgi:hypothetical protein
MPGGDQVSRVRVELRHFLAASGCDRLGMPTINYKRIKSCTILLAFPICLAALAFSQTPATTPKETGVIRIRVRVADGAKVKGLPRKRFFVFKGSLAQNKSMLEAFQQRPLVARDCYYRSLGASEALIAWLKKNDCESVYCREVGQADVEGPNAVPEFQKALADGLKEFGNAELARQWLAVNLPQNLLSGFYKKQTKDLNSLLDEVRKSKAPVYSTMTAGDINGSGYFVDLEPGDYTVSNVIPLEYGSRALVWNCDVPVKKGDIATEKTYLLSTKDNTKDKNIRCKAEERPLPVCPATPK